MSLINRTQSELKLKPKRPNLSRSKTEFDLLTTRTSSDLIEMLRSIHGNDAVILKHGKISIRRASPLYTHKRKNKIVNESVYTLTRILPYERSQRLQKAVHDITTEIRNTHPDLENILTELEECKTKPNIDDAIIHNDITRLKHFSHSEWTYEHMIKLLQNNHEKSHKDFYISCSLIATWMLEEKPESCLRENTPVILLLKAWLNPYNPTKWYCNVYNDIKSSKRCARLYFNSYLDHIMRLPPSVRDILVVVQGYIDSKQLQNHTDPPLLIAILFLRHFIPLYHEHSIDIQKIKISKLILKYCDNIPASCERMHSLMCHSLRS
jgi:hypothetical protein